VIDVAVSVAEEWLGEVPLVSEVRLRLVDEEKDGLVGYGSCVLLGGLYLNDIAIRRGRDGNLFLTYPISRSRSGAQHHVWNPICREAAKLLENAILGRVQEMGR
jgi:DNA-binding cell septation regulator SpoVG